MPADAELLTLFAKTGSESAFRSLVERHLPLVHSAALRQTAGDHHQAEEVAQAVFTLLARKAGGLQRHPALVGWLYTTTHHIAAKVRRSNQRRRRREQAAQLMPSDTHTPSFASDWTELKPVVDEVMLQLKDEDRTAVLLRFFENKPHQEIGARLGLSENAARMRVDRAIEALRSALARRGITSTAAVLSATLSSQAVMAPPAGLVGTIVVGATAAASGGGLFILMSSTVFKTAVATVVIAAGTGLLWQQRENRLLRAENSQLRAQVPTAPPLPAPAVAANPPAPVDTSRLLGEIETLHNSPANSWQERGVHLRQLVARVPELNIPEMQLATEEDWLDATKESLETEEDYRRALAKLRNVVISRFTGDVRKAILQYQEKTGQPFPTDPAQLEPYLERSLGASVWNRYVVQPASTIPMMKMGGDWIITQKAPIDDEYDSKYVIGPYGEGSTTYNGLAIQTTLAPVRAAYAAANPGQPLTDLAQLLPYATTPEQRAAIATRRSLLRK
jgi:RNA polymerase sigma factor (sigma-70 family)